MHVWLPSNLVYDVNHDGATSACAEQEMEPLEASKGRELDPVPSVMELTGKCCASAMLGSSFMAKMKRGLLQQPKMLLPSNTQMGWHDKHGEA